MAEVLLSNYPSSEELWSGIGGHFDSIWRLGGIKLARLTAAKPGTEGPPGTGVKGLAAAYRDRFPLKVSWQGAGLEQTGAAGGPMGAWLERVCGRLRRSQSRRRVAVRAEVPWAAKVLRGLEPSWRDWRRNGRDSDASGRTPE